MIDMWVPQPFFRQAVVLIADRPSFSAAYLVQTLTSVGCRVIGPFDTRETFDAWLAADQERPTGAVLALDWLDETRDAVFALLAERNVPFLMVDNAPWRHLSTVQASFNWPYAAFQILEALQNATFEALVPKGPSSANA